MTSLTSSLTSISADSFPIRGGTWVVTSKAGQEPILIPMEEATVRTKTIAMPLGYKLLSLTGSASFISGVFFFHGLFSSSPVMAPKFALFLTFLFGGLALELLWTKNLHDKHEW